MGAASSWQDAFVGASQESHSQAFCFDGSTDRRITRKTVTQTFEFDGLSGSAAHSMSAVSVRDTDGTTYSFTPACSFTDGSSGTMVFPTEQVRVTRTKLSPNLWHVTVQREGSRYYLNGSTVVVDGPDWAKNTGEL